MTGIQRRRCVKLRFVKFFQAWKYFFINIYFCDKQIKWQRWKRGFRKLSSIEIADTNINFKSLFISIETLLSKSKFSKHISFLFVYYHLRVTKELAWNKKISSLPCELNYFCWNNLTLWFQIKQHKWKLKRRKRV
jgi:hypothetical protein